MSVQYTESEYPNLSKNKKKKKYFFEMKNKKIKIFFIDTPFDTHFQIITHSFCDTPRYIYAHILLCPQHIKNSIYTFEF